MGRVGLQLSSLKNVNEESKLSDKFEEMDTGIEASEQEPDLDLPRAKPKEETRVPEPKQPMQPSVETRREITPPVPRKEFRGV